MSESKSKSKSKKIESLADVPPPPPEMLRQPTVTRSIVGISSDIVLGRWYRDSISGELGVATQWTLYINGCRMVCLDPGVVDGKRTKDIYTYDEGRLVAVDEYGNDIEPVRTLAKAGVDTMDAPVEAR